MVGVFVVLGVAQQVFPTTGEACGQVVGLVQPADDSGSVVAMNSEDFLNATRPMDEGLPLGQPVEVSCSALPLDAFTNDPDAALACWVPWPLPISHETTNAVPASALNVRRVQP